VLTDLDQIWTTDRGAKAHPFDVFREVKIPLTPKKNKFSSIFQIFLSQKWTDFFMKFSGLVGGKGPHKMK